MKLSIVFAFLLVLAVSNAYPSNSLKEAPSRSKPWFWHLKKIVTKFVQKIWYWNKKCHDLDCPKYEVEKTTDDYELRCYPAYTWVGTAFEGKEETRAETKEMFMRLFYYIQGQNTEGIKINMTVPVATKVETGSSTNRYTMLFFVPYEHQSSPPKPTNRQVSIFRLPKTCVYVRTFSWYTTESNVEENLKKLEEALKKDGITDYTDPNTEYIYGGYDSPWTLPWLRVNEVWLTQK